MKLILMIFFCTPLAVLSQNITGTWEGSGGGTTYIKMVITHKGDSLYGYTYDEGGGYCKATFLGRYSRTQKRLIGSGIRMIERTPNHVLVDYDLVYSKEPDGEFLRENIGETGFLEKLFGPRSRQYLMKTSNKVDLPKKPVIAKQPPATVPPVVKKEPIKTPPPVTKKEVKKTPTVSVKPKVVTAPVKKPEEKKAEPVKEREPVVKIPLPEKKVTAPVIQVKTKDERSSKLVQTIYTSADTVQMYVYDNGEVDGDTVTLFFDNMIILDRYRISDKAKEINLPVSRTGKQHNIELFANNLGSIPPNTALIIFIANKKRYELRASYDLNTNAKIIIQYQE